MTTDPHTAETTLLPEPPVPIALDAQALITTALQNNVGIETLERLFGLRERLRAEAARAAFFASLAAFQAECPIIGKDQTVDTGKYKYKYAPLDSIVGQVKGLLEKHGFSYTIDARFEPEPAAQVAVCTAHHVGGHSESSEFRIPIDRNAVMNEPQKHAAALTFAKRYAFANRFGIMTGDEDNDARELEKAQPYKAPQRASAATPAPAPAPPGPLAAVITRKQHNALEAAIREYAEAFSRPLEDVRANVKNHIGKEFGKEHFPDLTPNEYQQVMHLLLTNTPEAHAPKPPPKPHARWVRNRWVVLRGAVLAVLITAGVAGAQGPADPYHYRQNLQQFEQQQEEQFRAREDWSRQLEERRDQERALEPMPRGGSVPMLREDDDAGE